MQGSTKITRRAVIASAGGLPFAGAAAAQAGPVGLVMLNGLKVLRTDLEGKGQQELAAGKAPGIYDGVAYDPQSRQVYWTNMGRADADDGTVERVHRDGGAVTSIVPAGGTFTPKQMKIAARSRKLYWSDREGMRIQRCNFDGSQLETLVRTGDPVADKGKQHLWCVGIAVDEARGQLYWTQKGGDDAGMGSIRRAALNIPPGRTAADRRDIEVLFDKLPEPIDLELDLGRRLIYWTDRGDNTVNRAPMDPPNGFDPLRRMDRQVLVRGLDEAIGLALDIPGDRMFYTSLGGELGTARLDGGGARMLRTGLRPLTGIALIEQP